VAAIHNFQSEVNSTLAEGRYAIEQWGLAVPSDDVPLSRSGRFHIIRLSIHLDLKAEVRFFVFKPEIAQFNMRAVPGAPTALFVKK
jgi:hypothetical protein